LAACCRAPACFAVNLELHAAQQHLQRPMTMTLAAAMNTILLSNDCYNKKVHYSKTVTDNNNHP
jgi:hypothetical protein